MSGISHESLPGKSDAILNTLEALGLERAEYFIIGGANLVLRGIKKVTADIDMLVSEKTFEALKKKDGSEVKAAPKRAQLRGATNTTVWVRNTQLLVPVSATTEMGDGYFPMSFDDKRSDTELVQDIPCLGLDDVIAAKVALGRTKDLVDLQAIEEFTGTAIPMDAPSLRCYEPDYDDTRRLSLATALSLERMERLDS